MTSRIAFHPHRVARRVAWTSKGFGLLCCLGTFAACAAGTEPVGTTVDAAASGAGGGDGGAAQGTQDAVVVASSSGQGGSGGEGCDSFKRDGERKPLHLFVVIDKSSSMDGDKWNNTVNSVGAFAAAEASVGIDFALHFLPNPGAPTCDAQAYKEPDVGWGPLPDIAPDVATALEVANPDGQSSPMYPALGGALLATIERIDQFPGEAAAVLLMTDGAPQGPATLCSGVDPESTEAIAQLAANAFDRDNPVFTFVVGLQNVDLDFADAVADAGGTGEAFPIFGDNPAASLQEALDAIRSQALPCSYELPSELTDPDDAVSINEVNVEITVEGDVSTIPRNDDCDGAGWRYDDPDSPSEILLCPASCEDLRSDPVGRLEIVLGCETIVN